MPGYYLDPIKTAEAIDADGWLHTGDVSSVDDQGRFKIIDRIKNIVKLSQGEYVAVERLENIYSLCPLCVTSLLPKKLLMIRARSVAQILVHGDSLQDCVVAVVVVDPITFAPFASTTLNRDITIAALPTVLSDTKLVSALARELHRFGSDAKLNGSVILSFSCSSLADVLIVAVTNESEESTSRSIPSLWRTISSRPRSS